MQKIKAVSSWLTIPALILALAESAEIKDEDRQLTKSRVEFTQASNTIYGIIAQQAVRSNIDNLVIVYAFAHQKDISNSAVPPLPFTYSIIK